MQEVKEFAAIIWSDFCCGIAGVLVGCLLMSVLFRHSRAIRHWLEQEQA